MDASGGEAPRGIAPAEPPAVDPAAPGTAVRGGVPTAGIFVMVAAAVLLSFGGAWLVVWGAGRLVTAAEATPTPQTTATVRAGAPARTAATAASDRIRVRTASGRSRPLGAGQHEVTFTWVLEGARENDAAVVQFYSGTRALGQRRGTLDPTVFNFSTGALTLAATLDCSTGGWTAELITIRGLPVQGDAEAAAPGVQCP